MLFGRFKIISDACMFLFNFGVILSNFLLSDQYLKILFEGLSFNTTKIRILIILLICMPFFFKKNLKDLFSVTILSLFIMLYLVIFIIIEYLVSGEK